MTCGGENGTNGGHLAVLREHIAFACHFMANIGVLVVLAILVKNYLKWWAIQLSIQCTADTVNFLNSYRFEEKHMQAALIILKIAILN